MLLLWMRKLVIWISLDLRSMTTLGHQTVADIVKQRLIGKTKIQFIIEVP
jgi:hypothetical protein